MQQSYIFPTSSTCAVFLNGYHVELAYGFQYKESIPKIPIYGYNDYEYTKTVRGKGLVQGMMILNFTYPGYLSAVLGKRTSAYNSKLYNYTIAEGGPSADQQFQKGIKNMLATELPGNTDLGSKTARAEFIASLISGKNVGNKKKVKDAIIKFMTPKLAVSQVDDEEAFPKTAPNPLTISRGSAGGNELDVYYSDPEFAAYFVRFTNVEFTEISQQISQAGAEGSAENLYHICQFIARAVEIKQISE